MCNNCELQVDEDGFPTIVFKYRKWNDRYERTVITNREVFFSPPERFVDKKDCNTPSGFLELTDNEHFERLLTLKKKKNPYKSRLGLRVELKAKFNEWLPNKNQSIKNAEKEYWEKLNSCFGVLSLSVNPCSFRMWEEYAGGHEGFCAGFNTRKILMYSSKVGAANWVKYVDVLPLIHPSDTTEIKIEKETFYKEKHWSFEDEYRLCKTHPYAISNAERVYRLPEEAVNTIIFGAKMPSETKTEIIEIAKNSCKHAVFKQAVINADSETISIVNY